MRVISPIFVEMAGWVLMILSLGGALLSVVAWLLSIVAWPFEGGTFLFIISFSGAIVIFMFGMGLVRWSDALRKRRVRPGFCPDCGYNLRNRDCADYCPECGRGT